MLALDYQRHSKALDAGPCLIEEWLKEWGDWTLGRVGPDIPRCVSLESNYQSPQCWDAPEPPESVPVDWRAYRVERCVSRLPEAQRRAVRVEYTLVRQYVETDGQFFERKRRMAQLPGWQYWDVVGNARKSLEIMLGLAENIGGHRAP